MYVYVFFFFFFQITIESFIYINDSCFKSEGKKMFRPMSSSEGEMVLSF